MTIHQRLNMIYDVEHELSRLRLEIEKLRAQIADEREACAVLAEKRAAEFSHYGDDWEAKQFVDLANEIRARGQR